MLSPQERFCHVSQAAVSPVGHLLVVVGKGRVVRSAPLNHAFLHPDVSGPQGDECPPRYPPFVSLCNVTAQGDAVTGWGQLKEKTT